MPHLASEPDPRGTMIAGYVVKKYAPAHIVNEWSQYHLGRSIKAIGPTGAGNKVILTNWPTQDDYTSGKWAW